MRGGRALKEVNMIAVRTRTLRALPRRARRAFKMTWAPKKQTARERNDQHGFFESFEKMLESQTLLMFRGMNG
jgi:hypothetical protein